MMRSLLLASLAATAFAQSNVTVSRGASTTVANAASGPTPTLSLYINGEQGNGYAASVVSASGCTTLLGLVCTSGTFLVDGVSATCDPGSTATVTYAPGEYQVSSTLSTEGVAVTVVESCAISGTTMAVCSASVGASANGQSSSTSLTTTYSGADVEYYQVPITADATKLSSASSACSTGSPGAAAPTAIADVYKILVAPGVAAFMAGAALI